MASWVPNLLARAVGLNAGGLEWEGKVGFGLVTLTDHQGEEDGLAERDGRRPFALVFFCIHLFTKYKKTGCVTIATKTQTGCDVSRVNYAYPALLLVLHAEIKCITGTNDKRLGGTDGLRRAADGSNIKLEPL